MGLHVVVGRAEARAEAHAFDQMGSCRNFAMAIGGMTASLIRHWADSMASLVAHLQHSMTGAVRWRRATAPDMRLPESAGMGIDGTEIRLPPAMPPTRLSRLAANRPFELAAGASDPVDSQSNWRAGPVD